MASDLARSGNVEGALTLLEALRHEFPENAHYRFAAAGLLAQQGDADAARRMAADASTALPDDSTRLQVSSWPILTQGIAAAGVRLASISPMCRMSDAAPALALLILST